MGKPQSPDCKPLTFGSVCSGIEGASAAWYPLGWKCAWTAEIEPFPAAVIAERWGHKNYGDFREIGADAEPIELLVGGTPCQDFSVAGLRAGMAGDRGNLTLQFLELAQRTRPRWVVWENVPGVLSSNNGRDFGAFLRGLGELGYGFAYRILDAQYFGVPQRRRRVFVVGYFGDWRIAAAVLFERHSLSGNPAPSRKTGQGTSRSFESSSWGGGGETDIAPTLDARCKDGAMRNQTSLSIFHSSEIASYKEGIGTLRSEGGDCGGGSENLVAHALTVMTLGHSQSNGLGIYETEIANTLEGLSSANQAVTVPTLVSEGDAHSGFRDEKGLVHGFSNRGIHSDEAETLRAGSHGALPMASQGMTVRRLTPRECERLQGFKDDYTLIKFRGKPAADGPRYKALGNSWAVPVVRWIGERINRVSAGGGVSGL